jgi:hypothetical protein
MVQVIYDDAWSSRAGKFPAGSDYYREICYKRDDAHQTYRSGTVQEGKIDDDCVPVIK